MSVNLFHSRYIILVIHLLFFSILGFSLPVQSQSGVYYTVTKVIDGDTFWIDDGSQNGQKVRLIGIDAPESRKTRKKEPEAFAKESKAYLIKLLHNKKVRLELDVRHKDQYRRTLAYVYLSDATFVNAELVKNGFATVMTVPPNIKHAEEFVRFQQEARENNRGLWKAINR